MESKAIVVHLGLEESLKGSLPGAVQEVKKNIGKDKSGSVQDLYTYMMMAGSDELNPSAYTPEEMELAEFIKEKVYDAQTQGSPRQFMYKAVSGGRGYMEFSEKLSKYPDAFHPGNSNVEFGNLEETVEQEHVYLEAHRQHIGGAK
jgi:hypothetical protein